MSNPSRNDNGNRPARHDPYAALRSRDFRLLLAGNFIGSFSNQMVSFAIGWELWLRTKNALVLGLVGLVQVTPVVLFSLIAGHLADQHDRKFIVILTQAVLAVSSLGLAAVSFSQGSVALIYLCLFGIGVARAFNGPAASTLLPQTVPPEDFTNASTWSSSVWQLASIIGPAVAGLLVALLSRVFYIYAFDALAGLTFLVLVIQIHGRPLALSRKSATWDSLKEGIRFIRSTKEILAAITLDMFAVLFGGAVTLLPVYATDILHVGAAGLGIMRAAPSIGALLMAIVLAHLPPLKRAGRTLLIVVTGFGLATILFGWSRNFLLSVVTLAATGALDNVSVVIRKTLTLTRTPDEMRGRISAVTSIFISTSNELGGFESGLTASLFGSVLSVIGGGIGTILVVLLVAWKWPELRNLKGLNPTEIEPVQLGAEGNALETEPEAGG